MKAARHLDPLVQEGCELTVTQVKEFMSNLLETKNIEIYNGDVKNFLIEYHGDRVHFCPSHRVNES
jgi:hypothetical protein